MYCVKCGKELPENSNFCLDCGTKIETSCTSSTSMDFNIILENDVLRAQARKQLKGVWGEMAFTILVYCLITFPIQFLFWEYSPFHNKHLETLVTIAIFIVSGPFSLGFAGYFLKRIREEKISTSNIFDGFNSFFSSFLLMLLTYILVFLWSLLLIIPGIIKGLGYSMAYYIMYDEPDIKPIEALKKSQIMMQGYKGKLFMLYLRFFGWAILSSLALGIGWFWLAPYVGLSEGNFYENLKKNQEKKIEEPVATP